MFKYVFEKSCTFVLILCKACGWSQGEDLIQQCLCLVTVLETAT